MTCVKEIDEARALLTKAEKVASLDAKMSLIDEAGAIRGQRGNKGTGA